MLSSLMCNLGGDLAPPTIPIEERFQAKYRVDKRSGCWRWTSSIRTNGYSQFRYSRAKNGYGHVFAYEHFVGPVPDGHTLHHVCKNRDCVNPEHLEALPHREHLMRDDTPARLNAAKTHCKRGHPLSGDNVEVYRGHRRCKTCAVLWRTAHHDELRMYNRRYYQEHREQWSEYNQRAYQEKKGRK